MTKFKTLLSGIALASCLVACSNEPDAPVSEKRLDEWASETGATTGRKQAVKGLLATAARGKQRIETIEEPEKRRKALALWTAEVGRAASTFGPQAGEMFKDAGLASAPKGERK